MISHAVWGTKKQDVRSEEKSFIDQVAIAQSLMSIYYYNNMNKQHNLICKLLVVYISCYIFYLNDMYNKWKKKCGKQSKWESVE